MNMNIILVISILVMLAFVVGIRMGWDILIGSANDEKSLESELDVRVRKASRGVQG